ncbi:hypothetical protein TPA0908_53540 [Micromonospora sp. AKA38]|nr:hypothetical protein TPA0908_53540 [Micromonospora sp. AKA38]
MRTGRKTAFRHDAEMNPDRNPELLETVLRVGQCRGRTVARGRPAAADRPPAAPGGSDAVGDDLVVGQDHAVPAAALSVAVAVGGAWRVPARPRRSDAVGALSAQVVDSGHGLS